MFEDPEFEGRGKLILENLRKLYTNLMKKKAEWSLKVILKSIGRYPVQNLDFSQEKYRGHI